jgi:hypothetical protein
VIKLGEKFYIEDYFEAPAVFGGDFKNPGDKFRVMMQPYPHVIWKKGDGVPPLRCPACGSDQYSGFRLLLDEKSTFAVSPGLFDAGKKDFRYENYMILTCKACHYSYHFRPEGKWYTGNPYKKKKSFLDLVLKKLKIKQEPSTRRTKIIEQNSGHLIGKRQDYQIIELHNQKRYSSYTINPKITHSSVAVLTGAGFSKSLGLPASSEFQDLLPAEILNQLDKWLGSRFLTIGSLIDIGAVDTLDDLSKGRSCIYDFASNDIEILLDLLFRIQRIAVLIPDYDDFLNYLKNLKSNFESVFVFDENIIDDGYYPATTHLKVHKDYEKNCKTAHFVKVHNMLIETISTVTKRCMNISEGAKDIGAKNHGRLLDQLNKINNSPLPVFTTNYDRAVEQIFSYMDYSKRIITGAELKGTINFTFNLDGLSDRIVSLSPKYPVKKVSSDPFNQCNSQSIAYFHLHGCASWYVDPKTGNILEFDDREAGKEIILQAIENSDRPLVPACLFPSVVKDAYSISPPYNLSYDYLLQTIIHVKVFIIVGYSGRDESIKDILLWGVRNNPQLKFIVVDVNDTVPQHLLDVLPSDRTVYLSGGFLVNVDKIIENVNSLI